MNENIEIFENDSQDSKSPKPKSKRRPISSETRARLLLNLKKGRETSKLNRQKKSQAKKIKKHNEGIEIDETIKNEVMKKKTTTDEIEDLRRQLKELKELKSPDKKMEYVQTKVMDRGGNKESLLPKESLPSPPIKESLPIPPIKRGLQSKQDIINNWNKPKTKNLFTTRWDWN